MMKKRCSVALLSLFVFFQTIEGQNNPVNRADYRLQALLTDQAVTIDGILDEGIWSMAEKTGPFHRITPTDTGYAKAQTEVMIAYDEDNIYMGIICYDPSRERDLQNRTAGTGALTRTIISLPQSILTTIRPMALPLG